MTAELELTVVSDASDRRGYVSSFAVTDQMIVAVGGIASDPTVLASSNAREFEPRKSPRGEGLRDALAVGDQVWVCGEHGQLAVSRDQGAKWRLLETGTDVCLFGLALGLDGAIWVVGDKGYAARVLGPRPVPVDLGTDVRLSRVIAVRDEIVALGFDGKLRRWQGGKVSVVACGASKPLTGLAVTPRNTWIAVGDGGFIARSPDGQWYSKVASGTDVDLEAIRTLADGRIVIVGDRGHMLLSADDGRTWKPLASSLGAVHLWSLARFGNGLLIGAERGQIARLAPPGETTWSERVNVFAAQHRLDAVFEPGPSAFIANGLATYLEVRAREDEGGERDEEEDRPPVGAADDFQAIYGVALPAEARALFAAAPPASTLHELRLGPALHDVAEDNVFEQVLAGSRGLADAFAGAFQIGEQRGGDTVHLELYEWDGARQVLRFDRRAGAFAGVCADSLDSLVYLATLVQAGEAGEIEKATYKAGLRALAGKVDPDAFGLARKRELAGIEPKRRDSEFYFLRSRWIGAVLRGDLVACAALFCAELNQLIPPDQLPARFEACERVIPTALYAMWRSYLWDEPELDRYLEIGRRHAARLVRDAARLIDDLRAGKRDAVGRVDSWTEHLAKFRALDLDPRRAEQRALEAEVRARETAAHSKDVETELATTPPAGWSDLAWSWLGDGGAHRALLARLDTTQAPHIAALAELAQLRDEDRAAALPLVAEQLTPELEAVLVGSLVRDEQLGDLAPPPAPATNGEHEHGDADEKEHSPGWDAIDRALEAIYRDVEPMHYGTVVPYMLGGNDPIHGISVYPRTDPVPHWHFVTYGFTDLFRKETDDPEESGFGFELTLRLARAPGDAMPPNWALNFLQNLGRYVFGTGNRFAAGHKMGLNGPIALEHDTKITAICFADDPELGEISSEFGRARFVQIVGITDDEYKLIQEWSTTGLIDALRERAPFLITDLARGSVLDDPSTAAMIEKRVAAEGSSEDLTFAGDLTLEADDGRVRIELGALYAACLPRAMRGRLRHGRPYELRGRNATLHLRPGGAPGYRHDDGELVLEVTQELATEVEATLRRALAGRYRFETWPALEIVVTPSFIRSQDGKAIEVRGIDDAAEAARMLEAENARLAENDEQEAEDEEQQEEEQPAPSGGLDQKRVLAALALTERAMKLAPDDDGVQLTHSMLLLDANRADDLLAALPRFAAPVRIAMANRMAERSHPRFADAVDSALAAPLPEKIFSSTTTSVGSGGASMSSFGDVSGELFGELADAILAHAPDKLLKLMLSLPDDAHLLADTAHKALEAGQKDVAFATYQRLLALPIPEGDTRTGYLQAMNNACVRAHAAKAYELAGKIADRVQPVASENPYIFHAAACAYAALGDHAKAFEQVKLAIATEYPHLGKVEVDTDLGPLLEWPEFKALFREWHARQEGN
jgi:suppressor of fused